MSSIQRTLQYIYIYIAAAPCLCNIFFDCLVFSYHSFAGVSDESSEVEDDQDALQIGNERLEDDEELRMHILGLNSYYCKFPVSKDTRQTVCTAMQQTLLVPVLLSGMWRLVAVLGSVPYPQDTQHQGQSKCYGLNSVKRTFAKYRNSLTFTHISDKRVQLLSTSILCYHV